MMPDYLGISLLVLFAWFSYRQWKRREETLGGFLFVVICATLGVLCFGVSHPGQGWTTMRANVMLMCLVAYILLISGMYALIAKGGG